MGEIKGGGVQKTFVGEKLKNHWTSAPFVGGKDWEG